MQKREIKFRVWDDHNKKMVFPEYIEIPSTLAYANSRDIEDGIPVNGLLSQFTGINDQKGTMIYEGDYFREGDDVFICHWINEIGVFTWLTPDEIRAYDLGGYDALDDGGIPYNMGECNSIVIAGNIYEKPSVLTEFKEPE